MDYYGYPVRSIESDVLRVDFLADSGPRLVRLVVKATGKNLLAELPNLKLDTPYGVYHFHGGHRLWHSPEGMPRSYIPDDGGLVVEDLPGGAVRLIQPLEAGTGLSKTMELYLDGGQLTIRHLMKNEGLWPVECAPWAITQFALGGLAFIPQQKGVPEAQLLPDRILTIWNYTRLHDPRLNLDDDFIFVRGESRLPPCKVGTFNPHGWLGYLVGDVLFTKRFDPQPGQPHPDNGCNTEIYVNDGFIELESLGPLSIIQPGGEVAHSEVWQVKTGVQAPMTFEGVRGLFK